MRVEDLYKKNAHSWMVMGRETQIDGKKLLIQISI